MRAPRRRRPRRRTINVPLDTNLDALANRVSYVGSPEHKVIPSFAGRPRLRADASCCPREITDREMVSEWLRAAIRRAAVGAPWEGEFPRYVWYMHRNIVFEARLVNREIGSYKGYPLDNDEWPMGIEQVYAET
jgi:hypothetical protein